MPNCVIQPPELVPSPNNPLPLFAVWPETLDVGESGCTFVWRDRAVLRRLQPGDQGWAPRPWPTAPGHITEYLLLACGAVIVRNEFRHNISYKGKARFHDEISQQYGIRLNDCYDGNIDRDPTPAAEARELLRKRNYRHFLDCRSGEVESRSTHPNPTEKKAPASEENVPRLSELYDELPPIWIGDHYENGGIFGARILVMGESTYGDDRQKIFYYNPLIPQDHIDGLKDMFRGNLARAFLGVKTPTTIGIYDFWHSVVFFNYITEPLIGSRRAPTREMWRHFHQPLGELLESHRPDLLVLSGYRMWREFIARPTVDVEPLEFPINGADRACWFIGAEGHRALALGIRHPSGGFSWSKESAVIREALAWLSLRAES